MSSNFNNEQSQTDKAINEAKTYLKNKLSKKDINTINYYSKLNRHNLAMPKISDAFEKDISDDGLDSVFNSDNEEPQKYGQHFKYTEKELEEIFNSEDEEKRFQYIKYYLQKFNKTAR